MIPAERGHERGIIIDRVPGVGIEGRRVGLNEEEKKGGGRKRRMRDFEQDKTRL